MEEKTIFEGLIEEAKRVKKEHCDSDIMIVALEKCDDDFVSSCCLFGSNKDLTILLEHMMENNKNLEEIIRTAIIMYDVIKNELKK